MVEAQGYASRARSGTAAGAGGVGGAPGCARSWWASWPKGCGALAPANAWWDFWNLAYAESHWPAATAELAALTCATMLGWIVTFSAWSAWRSSFTTSITPTGAEFELLVLENDLFGPRVTTAGLLPGSSFQKALAGRRDLDLILIPGECLNDDGKFMDDLTFSALQAVVPVEIRPSKTFVDALEAPAAA